MKVKYLQLWMMTLLIIILHACQKDAAVVLDKPSIAIDEVGLNNSKVAYTGNDLHVDAAVTGPAKIASIKVQITLAETNYGWDFVKTYTTPYAGSKSADFHEHIDIPETAKAGKYTLLIVVTDEAGNKTQAKVDFEVIKDLSLPRITEASLKTVSASTLNFSGMIQAANKIAKLVVEVQSSAWTKTFTNTDQEMVDQTSYRLSKDIDLSGAPAGHYHVNITVFDKAGKQALYAYHLDK
ncbi:DUF4625 domain-containing protein [Mucilaginibacter sp. PAMB04168]|uniref:DUF4625 domain-containing protein n=1 Tax=Mucilaginibacter sp. PAMB04168 TaxID=3138567 RepID=UPI0031F6EE53